MGSSRFSADEWSRFASTAFSGKSKAEVLNTSGIVAAKIDEATGITRSALRDAVAGFSTPDLPSDLGALAGAAIHREALVVSFLARTSASRFHVVFPSLSIAVPVIVSGQFRWTTPRASVLRWTCP